MATAAASTVAKQLAPHYTVGKKQIYLPSHVVAMLRPRKNVSPNFATFKVPLSFNKLDLRDYLWNVYNVRVLSVRSMVNQQPLTTKGPYKGQVYRPLSEKLMIAELDKPFVWPDPPAEDERADFDYEMWSKFEKERESHLQERRNQMDGKIPLRTELDVPLDRQALADEAKALLDGRKEWKNSVQLDNFWKAIDTKKEARAPTEPRQQVRVAAAGASPSDAQLKDADIINEDARSPKRS